MAQSSREGLARQHRFIATSPRSTTWVAKQKAGGQTRSSAEVTVRVPKLVAVVSESAQRRPR